jgi:hypothetical protein
MKTARSIVLVALLAGCASVPARAPRDGDVSGHWEGFLLRNGLREPASVDLLEASNSWEARFGAGDNSVRLEDVRVTGSTVHFELPGEASFDGTVAGDRMAGSVSGPVTGSFSLTRVDSSSYPYFLGP